MIPDLKIHQPSDLAEVLALLDKHNSNIRIIAGGTDIVPGLQQDSQRFKNFNALLDINKIDDLKNVKVENDKLYLGASARFSDINSSEVIKKHFPLLAKAAGSVGSLQIRNLATIGGNFVNNAPCADSVPPLLVYNAVLKIKSLNSERRITLEDFLVKSYKTQLEPNEIVTEIEIPILDEDYSGDFYKLGRRRAVSISRITFSLLLKIKESKIIDFRVASGAVTPIGKRIRNIEKYALGKNPEDKLFKELSRMLGEVILEETGLRWSSPYKLPVVQQMFYQLLIKLRPDVMENK
ncbi:FAD binding domain-containing protein [Bacteroidota bacterium]